MWWASNRPMWDINLIHMGLLDQLRTVVNAYPGDKQKRGQ